MLLTKLKIMAAVMVLSLSACTCVVWAASQGDRQSAKAEKVNAMNTSQTTSVLVSKLSKNVLAGNEQQKSSSDASSSRQQDMDSLWNDLTSTDDVQVARALLRFAATPEQSTAFLKKNLKPVRVDADYIKKLVARFDDDDFVRRETATKELSKELEYLGKYAQPVLEQCLKDNKSAEVNKRIKKLLAQISPEKPAAVQRQLQKGGGVMMLGNGALQILPAPGAAPIPVVPPPAPAPAPGAAPAPKAPNPAPKAPKAPPAPAPVPAPQGFQIPGGALQFRIVPGGGLVPAVPEIENEKQVVVPRLNHLWIRAVRAAIILESFGTPEARNILKSLASGEADAPPTKEAKAALERIAKSK